MEFVTSSTNKNNIYDLFNTYNVLDESKKIKPRPHHPNLSFNFKVVENDNHFEILDTKIT